MMRDWRLWIVACGCAMHEGTRTKCGLRNRSAIKKCSHISGNIDIEPGGKLHKQVMRVLPIDQRLPIGNFAGRKEIRIAIVPHCRLKTHHRASSKATAFETALIFSHGNGPNGELVVPAWTRLLRIDAPGIDNNRQAH